MGEYVRMFDLTPDDRDRPILSCADGPASFNAEMTAAGGRIISCDPLYAFSSAEIARRIEETFQTVIDGARTNHERYVWNEIRSLEHLVEVRRTAMQTFLADFPAGRVAGRYVPDALPRLRFDAAQFPFAVCSHFLFTYSAHLSEEFHVAAIVEMCRVAREVRIFPLLDLDGTPSQRVRPVMEALTRRGFSVETRHVPYEFQKGGNQLLRVRAPARAAE